MSEFTTWIRVQDDFAQFDHPKDAELPEGVTVVDGYDEHLGAWARPPKPRTNKAGETAARTPAPEEKPAEPDQQPAPADDDKPKPSDKPKPGSR